MKINIIILTIILIPNNLIDVKYLLPANNRSKKFKPTTPIIKITIAIIINIGVNNS